MVISVDTGNKQIKTLNKTFTAGLIEHEAYPPFGKDTVRYKGRYYTLSDDRIPYMRDKTKDNRYFILNLFAIAFELNLSQIDRSDIVDITLLVGLPPAHYAQMADKFRKYFLKENEIIEFEFNRMSYYINIKEVQVYPQAFAAIATNITQIKQYNRAIIVDIGGFTSDILQTKNGNIDLSVCYSEEHGTIQFYNEIRNKVTSSFDMLIEETDIDRIIYGHETVFPKEVISLVKLEAQKYVNDFLNAIREYGIDLKSCQTVFAGGGSILFREFLEKSEKLNSRIFLNGLNTNAKGYDILYSMSRR